MFPILLEHQVAQSVSESMQQVFAAFHLFRISSMCLSVCVVLAARSWCFSRWAGVSQLDSEWRASLPSTSNRPTNCEIDRQELTSRRLLRQAVYASAVKLVEFEIGYLMLANHDPMPPWLLGAWSGIMSYTCLITNFERFKWDNANETKINPWIQFFGR